MILVLTAAAVLFLGWEIAHRVWPRDAAGAAERALYAVLLGFVTWIGSTWLLALASMLLRPLLLARIGVFAAAAVVLLWRRRQQASTQRLLSRNALVFAAFLAPLAAWFVFALWRGLVLPPVSHDALSYHLPKAVLYARAHGYDPLVDLQWLLRVRPANYELLLGEAIAGAGDDTTSEWISTLFYVAFVLSGVALAERWLGRSRFVAIGMALLTGGVPVLLLHSSAHKNDVMAAFFAVAGLVALGRFLSSGERSSLALLMLAFAAAVGTKASVAAVVACAAPFVAWRLIGEFRRDANRGRLAAVIALGFASFFVLGGWVFIERLLPRPAAATSHKTILSTGYGQWENLWQGPYILLTAPFSRSDSSLNVPWDARPWFWRRYEIYFSDDGIPFALCMLALPVAFALTRRERSSLRERNAIATLAFVAFLLLLPTNTVPLGLFSIQLPRLTLFLIPVVFALTAAPLLAWLEQHRPRAALATLTCLALFFIFTGWDSAISDSFAPLDSVLSARRVPGGSRIVPFDMNRAATVADRLAAPNDTIAVHAGGSAWILPAYGRDLTRTVILLRADTPASAIPDAARWVVFDHGFDAMWSSPKLRSLGDREFERGKPNPAALAAMQTMRGDSRFETVRYNPGSMQAVFMRR